MGYIIVFLLYFFALNLNSLETREPEIDFQYFEKYKDDLVEVEKFLGQYIPKALKNRNVFIGIRDFTNNPQRVQILSKKKLNELKELNPVGVILFRENFKDAEQIKELIDSLKATLGENIFIGVDEEGGIVNRASENKKLGVYAFPPMEYVGLKNDPHIAYKIGEVMGKQLRRLGINVNMAPVGDMKFSPDSPLGSRTFGYIPYSIGLMVEAFIDGIQRQEVSAIIKHFPGLGGTKVDTHKDLALLSYSKNFLMLNSFVPFVFAKNADFIMVGHIFAPKISNVITSLSSDIVNIIKDSLNIYSLIITDALDMGAITNNLPIEKAAKKSLDAGVHIVLIPDANFKKLKAELERKN